VRLRVRRRRKSSSAPARHYGKRQQIFPLPFLAVLVWSIAPVLVYIGIVLRLRGQRSAGTALVVAGLFLECTVLISFGAAPFFVPLVLLPLAITTTIALKRSPVG